MVWEIGSLFKCLKAFSLLLSAFDTVEWEIVFKSTCVALRLGVIVKKHFFDNILCNSGTIERKAVCKAGILKHLIYLSLFDLKYLF